MDNEELEIHNSLPHYHNHAGPLTRKFGSYKGDLVLITEYIPPASSAAIDLSALVEKMTKLNRAVEDDFIFDYCGTFLCPNDFVEDNENESMLKSLVFFPEGGILSGVIFSDVKLGWSFRIQIAINIARALCHLHNNNIVHNDIHTQSLALDSEWTCKLLDMFYAVRVEDIYSSYTLTGTEILRNDSSAYAAPEVHTEGKCSAASDIYSFGLCIFEICSRVLVTSIHKNTDLYRDSAADFVLDHLPDSIPDSLRELIRQMLSLDPDTRPTVEDVLDWLESLLTETCLEDDPPLPPLPKLPFPDRRKSSRMTRDPSFVNSPGRQSLSPQKLTQEMDSPDRRRGGGYAISKSDADRLKNLAKLKRDSDESSASPPVSAERDHQAPGPSSECSLESSVMICVANESGAPDLEGYLQLKADNLPFYKNKFFFFKENNLVWCSDIKLRDQPERLHYFDLSTARISTSSSSSHLSIHLELDPTLAADPLPGQPRKKLFRSSRVRDRLLIKFSSEAIAKTWNSVLAQEINLDRCKMCRVTLDAPPDRHTSHIYANKDFFCSPMCVNYYVATTARGMQLSGKTLQLNNTLRLSKSDLQALDKKLIARRNPKTWKRILKKEGNDLSHGILKEEVEAGQPLPQSVEEWLRTLGLECLLNVFMDSGYDCIGHIIIASLREEDMNYLQIEDKKVRLLLMTKSKALGETYVKNRNYMLSREDNVLVV